MNDCDNHVIYCIQQQNNRAILDYRVYVYDKKSIIASSEAFSSVYQLGPIGESVALSADPLKKDLMRFAVNVGLKVGQGEPFAIRGDIAQMILHLMSQIPYSKRPLIYCWFDAKTFRWELCFEFANNIIKRSMGKLSAIERSFDKIKSIQDGPNIYLVNFGNGSERNE